MLLTNWSSSLSPNRTNFQCNWLELDQYKSSPAKYWTSPLFPVISMALPSTNCFCILAQFTNAIRLVYCMHSHNLFSFACGIKNLETVPSIWPFMHDKVTWSAWPNQVWHHTKQFYNHFKRCIPIFGVTHEGSVKGSKFIKYPIRNSSTIKILSFVFSCRIIEHFLLDVNTTSILKSCNK